MYTVRKTVNDLEKLEAPGRIAAARAIGVTSGMGAAGEIEATSRTLGGGCRQPGHKATTEIDGDDVYGDIDARGRYEMDERC